MKRMPVPSMSAPRRLLSLAAFVAALPLVPLAFAQSTWNGLTTGDWNTGSNWTGTTVPTTSDDLTILGPVNAAGTLAINLSADANANTINFTDTSAVTLTNTASGADRTLNLTNGLTVGTGAVTIGSTTANQGVKIALGANQAWNIGSGGLIASNVVSGAFSLTKSGAGTLTLSGANTFSGGLTINAGTVNNDFNSAAFGTGTITVNTGGTLELSRATKTGNSNLTATNALSLNGGSIFAYDNRWTLSGNMAVGASGGTLGSTYNGGGADNNKGLAFTGVVSGSGNLTIQHTRYDSNQVWVTSYVNFSNNANTYSGTITLNQNTTSSEGGSYLGVKGATALQYATVNLNGNIVGSTQRFGTSPIVFGTGISSYTLGALSGSGNVNLTSYNDGTHAVGTDSITLIVGGNNANTTYSGVISNGAVAGGKLTKNGSGTMTLSGANTFTGATTVNAGTLATDSTGTFGAGNVTVAAGAGLTFGNNTSIGDLSSLVFASTSSIALNFTGAETIGSVQNSVSSTFLAAGTYDSNALNSFFGGSAFSGTGSITISAVPEPATYAAIFGGLALVGTVLHRRRRASA